MCKEAPAGGGMAVDCLMALETAWVKHTYNGHFDFLQELTPKSLNLAIKTREKEPGLQNVCLEAHIVK